MSADNETLTDQAPVAPTVEDAVDVSSTLELVDAAARALDYLETRCHCRCSGGYVCETHVTAGRLRAALALKWGEE